MGLMQDLYNWIAQRNLGGVLGMKWEPDRDMRHQRERFMEHVNGQLEHLNTAKTLLQNGDVKRAGEIAYRTFALFPFAIVPELLQAHELANQIIAKLPEDFVPPDPGAPIVQRRIAADKVAAHIAEAKNLANEGKYPQALTLLDNDSGFVHIFTYGGTHAIDMRWELPRLANAIRDKLDQTANRG